MAEPELSTPVDVGLTALRGLCILGGGTLLAHRLVVDGVETGVLDGAEVPGYGSWLADALSPDEAVAEALGSTLLLAAPGILLGVIAGLVVAALLRTGPLRSAMGHLTAPYLAFTVPGLLLFPAGRWLIDRGAVGTGPISFDGSTEAGLGSLLWWAGLVGLAIAPAVAALVAGRRDLVPAGASPAAWQLASRPEPRLQWQLGVPATAFLLAIASVELQSDQRGLFGLFAESMRTGESRTALDLIFLVVVGAAVLAMAVDLVGLGLGDRRDDRFMPPPGAGARTAERPRGGRVALVVAAALGAAAIAGYSIDAGGSTGGEALAGPTIGGPWLGTGAGGESVLAETAAALGPTALHGLLPAVVATVVGAVAAVVRRRSMPVVDRVVGTVVDLFWWPLPFLIPLLLVFHGAPSRPELHPDMVAVTGLALVPLASRLLGRRPLGSAAGLWWLLAVWGFVAAVSASINLVVGFAGLDGLGRSGDGPAGLGRQLADGVATYDQSAWPVIVPLLMAAALLATLYRLAGVAVGRSAARSAPTEGAERDSYPPAQGASVDADATIVIGQGGPAGPLAGPEHDAIDLTEPHEPEPDRAPISAGAEPVADRADPSDSSDRPSEADDEAGAGREDATAYEQIDDDEPAMAAEAAKTIELRPSTLRRAGVTVKPVLARRPSTPSEPQPEPDGRDD